MRILDKAVYVGPSLYAHFPVIRLDVDLGELENWPSVKLGRGVHRRPGGGAAGAAGAQLLLRQAGRVHPPADRGRRHLDGPHPGARRHRAPERRRRAGHLRQDPLARDHRPVSRHLPVRAGGRRDSRRGGSGSCCCTPCFRRSSGPRARCRRDFDFAAERDEFIRYAQRRHLGPSTMSLVRAAEERKIPWIRLNEQSLIQFGHGRYQQRIQATVTSRTLSHRGRAGLGQGGDQPHPRQPRPPGAAAAAGAGGGGRGRGGGADRLSGGGEAVQRQSRARHHHPHHDAPTRCARRSRWRGSTAAASSSRASSPATTTGCW